VFWGLLLAPRATWFAFLGCFARACQAGFSVLRVVLRLLMADFTLLCAVRSSRCRSPASPVVAGCRVPGRPRRECCVGFCAVSLFSAQPVSVQPFFHQPLCFRAAESERSVLELPGSRAVARFACQCEAQRRCCVRAAKRCVDGRFRALFLAESQALPALFGADCDATALAKPRASFPTRPRVNDGSCP